MSKNVLINNYIKKIKSLQTHCMELERKIKRYESIAREKNNAISKVFTTSQQNLLYKKKKVVKWTDEDITRAFTLKYLSVRAYAYLRQHLQYPLPGFTSLKRWSSRVDMTKGHINMAYKFLKISGQNFKEEEKLVVLQYDEVKVAETYEYDQRKDRIVGPHSMMQVVNARSLFGKWTQPVYVNFDTNMSKTILTAIIKQFYEIGFVVVACVSDCGPANVGLWRQLGINFENTSIKHPITGTNIYFFPDAPHLLKLIRNWLLDSEFHVNGKTINKSPLENLIKETRTEINSCFKIGSQHLLCEGVKRQNVALAAQLLSHTTSTALRHYYPNDELTQNTAEFIEVVNNWFDVMNSYVPVHTVRYKSGFGKYWIKCILLFLQ